MMNEIKEAAIEIRNLRDKEEDVTVNLMKCAGKLGRCFSRILNDLSLEKPECVLSCTREEAIALRDWGFDVRPTDQDGVYKVYGDMYEECFPGVFPNRVKIGNVCGEDIYCNTNSQEEIDATLARLQELTGVEWATFREKAGNRNLVFYKKSMFDAGYGNHLIFKTIDNPIAELPLNCSSTAYMFSNMSMFSYTREDVMAGNHSNGCTVRFSDDFDMSNIHDASGMFKGSVLPEDFFLNDKFGLIGGAYVTDMFNDCRLPDGKHEKDFGSEDEIIEWLQNRKEVKPPNYIGTVNGEDICCDTSDRTDIARTLEKLQHLTGVKWNIFPEGRGNCNLVFYKKDMYNVEYGAGFHHLVFNMVNNPIAEMPLNCSSTARMFFDIPLSVCEREYYTTGQHVTLSDDFDMSGVVDALEMFEASKMPNSFKLPAKFSISKVKNIKNMFYNCVLPNGRQEREFDSAYEIVEWLKAR